jgi:hypothetical protein
MGKTTFTGPIRAGNILQTSGTTLGQNVKNVGSVVMVQVFPITQAGTATALGTQIVLPANSHILNIQAINTVAWDATNTMTFGFTSAADELVPAAAMTIGLVSMNPGSNVSRINNWDDTGTTDKRVWVKSTNTGAGVGTITVRYIQAHDLA